MTVQNNYVLGLASLALLTAPEAGAMLRRDSARFGGYEIQFAQVADLFSNPEHRDDACKSLLVMHMCSLIKDSFELCKHHCEIADSMQQMRAEPWYQFCRLVRNCIGHNFAFKFSARDIAVLPATWRGRSITPGMNRGPLPLTFFGYGEAWELFQDIRAFAVRTGV